MRKNMDYLSISKESIAPIYKARNALENSSISKKMRTLIELRVSQINTCSYCCQVHTEEARKQGYTQKQLDMLVAWENEPSLFTSQECQALKWAEHLTFLGVKSMELRSQMLQDFSEKELVDLTSCISLMNAINRIAASLKA